MVAQQLQRQQQRAAEQEEYQAQFLSQLNDNNSFLVSDEVQRALRHAPGVLDLQAADRLLESAPHIPSPAPPSRAAYLEEQERMAQRFHDQAQARLLADGFQELPLGDDELRPPPEANLVSERSFQFEAAARLLGHPPSPLEEALLFPDRYEAMFGPFEHPVAPPPAPAFAPKRPKSPSIPDGRADCKTADGSVPECKICMANDVKVNAACGHMLCNGCARKLQKECPFCKQPVLPYRNVFFS
jgi:hypothetical protein